MSSPIRVVDLFAGAGGLTAGLHTASSRFKVVAAVEWDAAAAASYEATNGPGLVYPGDIRSWLNDQSVPGADVIVGGPPCQGFSTLGKRDIEDERNLLWEQYARTIRLANPSYFVVENVAEFKKSPQYAQFKAETLPGGSLRDYDFKAEILNAADYGAPQRRRRTVVIGFRRDLGFPGFPPPTHSAEGVGGLHEYSTVGKALAGVPATPDQDHVFSSKTTTFMGREFRGAFSMRELHWSRKYTELSRRRFAVIPAGGNRRHLEPYPELMAPCWVRHKSGSGDVMGRLHWDRPSVTIRTEFFKPEKGRYIHPFENRAITHYEAAILQGFDTNQRFVGSRTDIARQIGNAVPIPLGAAIGALLSNQI